MSLKLVIGGAGAGKTHYCWEELKSHLAAAPLGAPCIMLVPEQASFTYEKMLVKTVATGGSIRGQVLSFQRLAHLLLTKKSLVQPVYMNEMGRVMVLSELIRKHQDQLTALKQVAGNPGFAAELGSLFKEFQQYCISPLQLQAIGQQAAKERAASGSNKISQEFNRTFAEKLQDICLLYEAWRGFRETGYLDHEEILTQLLAEIPQSDWLKDAVIWVDSFATFSRQEQLVLLALARHCKEVTVTFCLPAEILKYPKISAQNGFYHIYQARERLLAEARAEGISMGEEVRLSHCKRYQERPALAELEKGLLTYPVRRYLDEVVCEEISLCKASDMESEIIYAARKIHQLARERQWHYRDFAIITRDISRYQQLIKKIFAQLGIPVYIDEKQSLGQHPLAEVIRGALEVVAEGWRTEAVFRYLKSGLAWERREDIDLLETYALAAGIHYQRWRQKKDWTYLPKRWPEGEKYSLDRINGLRREMLAPLMAFADGMKQSLTGKDFVGLLLQLLTDLQVEEKISRWYAQDLAQGDFIQAEIHQRIPEEVGSFLQQIETFMGEGVYTAEELLSLLEQGFQEMKIAMTPPALDGVFLSDVENSRMPEVSCSFVIGLNEGFFPAKSGEDGFFSSGERDTLEKYGVLLGPNRDKRQYIEEYLLYIAMTRSREYLFLSYPMTDEKGSPLLPCLALGKIKEMFPTLQEVYFSGKPEDLRDKQLLVGGDYDFMVLGNVLREVKKGQTMADFWPSVYNYYLQHPSYQGEMAKLRKVLLETKDVSYLSSSVVNQLYGKQIYSSVSRLEKFRQCPFAHFAGFGLQLRKRLKYQPGTAETGSIFHETLAYTGKALAVKNLTWADLSPEEAQALAEEAVSAIAGEYWGDIAENEAKYDYLQGKLARLMAAVMVAMGEQLQQGAFRPIGWEISFGLEKDLPALTLDLPGGGKLVISGAIDRVDCAQSENQTWLRVVDYKSSDKNLTLNDMFYGLKMQLLLYMQVALSNSVVITKGKAAESAGVYYFTLKDAMVKSALQLDTEAAKQAWLKEFKMNGIAVKDVEAVLLADKDINGISSVIPIAMNQEGEFWKNSPGLTATQMESMQKHILRLLSEAGQQLLQGFIGVKPWRQGNFDACTYCDFKAVCGFSRDMLPSAYEKVLTEEEVWQEIQREEGTVDAT
ncbi:MAG: helicase-exonuclease AddAB subunit AddB [Peptococcaceae bacterium]|nr:helicase-exonuclease AddAB subunit AddB [Peptococcaceae bacterium]